jgi:hypothetical protein
METTTQEEQLLEMGSPAHQVTAECVLISDIERHDNWQ